MATFVPLLSYEILNNKTFDVNQTHKGTGYELKLNSVHVNSIGGFTEKVFENYEGTDIIHVRIGGVNISMDLDGELDALYFIPLKASQVNVTNATIDFEVRATSDDNVHWALVDNSSLTIDHFDIKM